LAALTLALAVVERLNFTFTEPDAFAELWKAKPSPVLSDAPELLLFAPDEDLTSPEDFASPEDLPPPPAFALKLQPNRASAHAAVPRRKISLLIFIFVSPVRSSRPDGGFSIG
jgi:hypothetical protein